MSGIGISNVSRNGQSLSFMYCYVTNEILHSYRPSKSDHKSAHVRILRKLMYNGGYFGSAKMGQLPEWLVIR